MQLLSSIFCTAVLCTAVNALSFDIAPADIHCLQETLSHHGLVVATYNVRQGPTNDLAVEVKVCGVVYTAWNC